MISLLRYISNRRRTFLYLLIRNTGLGVVRIVAFAVLTCRFFSSYVGVEVVQAHLDRLRRIKTYIALAMDHIDEKTKEFIFNGR
jgi:hypothetical protein